MTRTFDTAGQMTSRTDRNGNTTTFTYNTQGDLTAVTDPLGHQTQFAYDAGSRLTQVTDALGNVTTYAYDSLSRVTSVTDALGNADARAYDAKGNLITYTDRRGNDWTQSFDALNRLSGRINPTGGSWQYAYDAAGNLTTHTDAKGQATTKTYDALNRLTGETFADSSTATYTYDPNGNLLTAVDASSDYTFIYDALNRQTQYTDNLLTKSVLYGVDAESRLTSKTGPEGDVVTYVYDAADRLVTLTEGAGTSTMTYDDEGNRLTDSRPNGVVTTTTYDANNRPLSITHTGPTGSVLQSFAYSRDNVGRTIQTVRESGENITYTHDAVERVVGESGGQGDGAYTRTSTFDANGNRTQLAMSGGADIFPFENFFTYNAANRPLAITDGAATLVTYTHDANGSRTAKDWPSFTLNYGYDARNRLSLYSDPGVTSTYTYDVFNRLIAVNSTVAGTRRIMYGAPSPILEDNNGTVTTCSAEPLEYASISCRNCGFSEEIEVYKGGFYRVNGRRINIYETYVEPAHACTAGGHTIEFLPGADYMGVKSEQQVVAFTNPTGTQVGWARAHPDGVIKFPFSPPPFATWAMAQTMGTGNQLDYDTTFFTIVNSKIFYDNDLMTPVGTQAGTNIVAGDWYTGGPGDPLGVGDPFFIEFETMEKTATAECTPCGAGFDATGLPCCDGVAVCEPLSSCGGFTGECTPCEEPTSCGEFGGGLTEVIGPFFVDRQGNVIRVCTP